MQTVRVKRMVSLLLITMLGWVLLVGCANNSVQNAKSTETGNTAKENKQEAAAENPHIVVFTDRGIIQTRPEGSHPEWLREVQDYIEGEIGIRVSNIIPPNDPNAAKTKLNLMLSSNEQLDIWQGSWAEYKDTILPLNDLLDKYGQDIKEKWSEEAWKLMTDNDGNIWGIPRAVTVAAHPIFVRADWLEALNLQMPKTLDELEMVLKAFKEGDPDGNGKDDTIPLMTETTHIRKALVGAFTEHGDSNWLDPADNKIKPVELDPGYKDFLAKMAEWYKKGYIFKDAFGTFDHLQMMKSGKIGVEANWYSRTTLQSPQVAEEIPGLRYEVAYNITGPKGLLQTANPGNTTAIVINKNSKNPEAAMKFINWQYQDVENHLVVRYGLKGKSWEWSDDAKFTFDLIDTDQNYIGELNTSNGLALESQYVSNDPLLKKHADFLRNEHRTLDNVKIPIDAGVFYDPNLLQERVPNVGDLDRLRTEEMVKFIMGARPIDEYDQFIQELYKAGLDKWIDFHTEQYMSQQKK